MKTTVQDKLSAALLACGYAETLNTGDTRTFRRQGDSYFIYVTPRGQVRTGLNQGQSWSTPEFKRQLLSVRTKNPAHG